MQKLPGKQQQRRGLAGFFDAIEAEFAQAAFDHGVVEAVHTRPQAF